MKLTILTEESVLSGSAQTGVGEVTDSLASVMTSHYDVSVVCRNGGGLIMKLAANTKQLEDGVQACRMLGVNYYMISHDAWPEKAIKMIDRLTPDILHNFAAPELLSHLAVRPARCVYTIDQAKYVRGKEQYLINYDAATTVSEAYAQELLAAGDKLAETLATMDFRGITNGILTQAFTPEKGLFIPAKYNSDDLSGKDICRERLNQTYGISADKPIYLMMCRLVPDKGVDEVLDAVHTIRDSGGFTIIVGRGNQTYEARLKQLTRADGVLWIDKWPHPLQAMPMLSGADFYLCPSIHEPCCLMSMTACRYAAVPICTLNGGLRDNMDDDCAIVIGDDGMAAAVTKAAELYPNKEALAAKRKVCMEKDFSWNTRKSKYLEVYGL